ncbi:MAG: hypothetical protein PUG71_08810, partial [bacterium]|nr:hypothetical protein [bacterium]
MEKRVMKKSMRKLLVLCLSLAMLVGSTLNVSAGAIGDFNVTLKFEDVDTGVNTSITIQVNGEEGTGKTIDITPYLPEGYEIDGQFTTNTMQTVWLDFNGSDLQLYVKKIPVTETNAIITFETVYGEKVGETY